MSQQHLVETNMMNEQNATEEFIPIDVDSQSTMNVDRDDNDGGNKQVDGINTKMEHEETSEVVYEKKIPKAVQELKKIFPDDFDFDALKNQYGLNEALGEKIEKVIVQEGTGMEATPGSVIRFLEACVVFFKRNEHSDWESFTHSNTLLQENRLKINKVPPIFLKCIHTIKMGERAFFKIHKDLYPELKITRLDPVQDDVEREKFLDLMDCYDYYGVQYICISYLELKEAPSPIDSFETHLESIIKKRLEGNVHFKEFSFSKALKSYNTGIIFVSEAKLDEGKIDEQKRILKEERVKLLVNVAKCHTSLNTEKNHKLCLDTCDKILFYDEDNFNAYYLKSKTYNNLDDYSRGLECMEKAMRYFKIYQEKNTSDPDQQKKDLELKKRMEIVEKQLVRKKALQEEQDNKVMKSKMSNMFSEELYADTEPYDEEEFWRKQQEEDERLGRKPWFMSDGTIHYQQL